MLESGGVGSSSAAAAARPLQRPHLQRPTAPAATASLPGSRSRASAAASALMTVQVWPLASSRAAAGPAGPKRRLRRGRPDEAGVMKTLGQYAGRASPANRAAAVALRLRAADAASALSDSSPPLRTADSKPGCGPPHRTRLRGARRGAGPGDMGAPRAESAPRAGAALARSFMHAAARRCVF